LSDPPYDVVVLGAGPAGEVCAGKLGLGGLRVALVEEHLVGGECSYYACMPSKALLRPLELMTEVRRIPGVREAVRGDIDAPAVLTRRDEVVHRLDDTTQLPWLERRHVALVRGRARLAGERRVEVDGEALEADRAVVVAVGSDPVFPDVPGLADARPWTNRRGTTSETVPERLIVMGGGPVGVELAQAWSSLGSAVTLVERAERLLHREEPFASAEVEDGLRAAGVDVVTGTEVTAVSRNGAASATLSDGRSIAADELLLALGRRPRTLELGLESVGLEPGAPIEVDDAMRSTAAPWLYAVGDVNGRTPFTHMGKYHARLAAANILGGHVREAPQNARSLSPRVIFTEPQVAAIGHTLASAERAGIRAVAADAPTQGSAGASFFGRDTPGTSRLVVDRERGVLVGATFVGPEVGEMIHAATVAIVGEVPLERLAHAVPSFPTRNELWLYLLEAYEQRKEAV
jgi:pyruvate/2-oxoglutarate dehydrogenase complex dihydrolipoamide dehydrogenase (E3) component